MTRKEEFQELERDLKESWGRNRELQARYDLLCQEIKLWQARSFAMFWMLPEDTIMRDLFDKTKKLEAFTDNWPGK